LWFAALCVLGAVSLVQEYWYFKRPSIRFGGSNGWLHGRICWAIGSERAHQPLISTVFTNLLEIALRRRVTTDAL
jgi:hypothetical protein